MTLPTIHMNGTSLRHLQEANEKASGAIREAIEALAQTAPNGRDYYPQSNEAIHDAMEEHWARMNRLQLVRLELEHIGEYLADEELRRRR
jgi:hypothetical protein